MIIFKMDDGYAKPTEYIKGIYPFSDIYSRDKSRDKHKAVKDFTFIEYYCSPRSDNPFSQIPESKRTKEIISTVPSLKGYKPDKLVMEGVDAYMKIIKEYSANYRMYNAAKNAVDELVNILSSIGSNNENPCADVLKASDITRAIKDMTTISENLNKLQKLVHSEFSDNQVFGGSTDINFFEK